MAVELSDCVSGALDRDTQRRTESAAKAMEKTLKTSGSRSAHRKSRSMLSSAAESEDNSLTHFFTSSKHNTATTGAARLPTTIFTLHVQSVEATIQACRLDANNLPVGEALWTILAKSIRESTSEALHFHRYRLRLQHLSLFMATQSPTMTSTNLVALIKARFLELSENMPQPIADFSPPTTSKLSVPQWGKYARLLESYAPMFGRAHDLTAEQLQAQPHVFCCSFRREYNTRRRTDDIDVRVVLDRVSVSHHPAHEGDHWLFVILAWAGDAPLPVRREAGGGSDDNGSDGGDSSHSNGPEPPALRRTMPPEVDDETTAAAASAVQRAASSHVDCAATTGAPVLQPFLARTNVHVEVRDVLVEYLPYSRSERVVLLIPDLKLKTGDIISASPKVILQIFIDEPVVVLLHDKFYDRLLKYDSDRGKNSVFGSSRQGVRKDLEKLGFVPLATLEHKYATKKAAQTAGGSSTHASQQSVFNFNAVASQRFNPSLRFSRDAARESSTSNLGGSVKADPAKAAAPTKLAAVRVLIAVYEEKPFVVDVSGLQLELSAAWDSFLMFQALAHHFISGNDAAFLPSPRFFVGSSGPHYRALKMPPPKPPAPPKRPAPEHATEPRAYVGGMPIYKATLEAGEDPLADVRDEYGNLKRVSTDDTFDIVEPEEMMLPTKVNWLPPDHVAPPEQSPAHGGGRTGGLGRYNFSTASIDTVSIHETKYDWAPGFLGSLFTSPRHFNRANTDFRRRDTDVPAKPLPHCPRPAIEIVISDSSVKLLMCGGGDFVSQKREEFDAKLAAEFDLAMSTNFRLCDKADGTSFYRSKRNAEDELLVAEFNGVFVQVDVFEPGHNMQQRIHVISQEVTVHDWIRDSPVRQLLWLSIPEEQRDRPAFEMRWTSFAYSTEDDRLNGLGELEEDIAIRTLPLHVSLSRLAFDLLKRFLMRPDLSGPILSGDAHHTSPPTANAPGEFSSASPPLFFRRFALHPLSVRLSWYPDLRDLSAMVQGDMVELASIMTIEGSAIDLSDIVIHGCPAAEIGDQLRAAVLPMLYTSKVIFLFAGLQPLRTATEVAGALSDLVVTPLEYLQNNKSIYNGIARGLAICTKRLAGETLRVASGATRLAHEGVHYVAQPAMPHAYADNMMRGNQPEGLRDGLTRGATSVARGVASMGTALRSTMIEATYDGTALAKIPLSLLLPVDAAFRGLTEVLLGARNAFQPERRRDEVQEFKSTKFSGRSREK
jgi:hypothetical protein